MSWNNIGYRKTLSMLTILSVAIATALIVFISLSQAGMQKGAAKGYAPFDVVIGAEGSSVQMALNTFYHVGAPTGNIEYGIFEQLQSTNLADAAYAVTKGDNLKGFQIVGISAAYFNTRYPGVVPAEGAYYQHDGEVVIGAHVAEQLGLRVGDEFQGGHGLVEAAEEDHHNFTYKIVGIMPYLGTPDDKAVFTTLNHAWIVHPHDAGGEAEHVDRDAHGHAASAETQHHEASAQAGDHTAESVEQHAAVDGEGEHHEASAQAGDHTGDSADQHAAEHGEGEHHEASAPAEDHVGDSVDQDAAEHREGERHEASAPAEAHAAESVEQHAAVDGEGQHHEASTPAGDHAGESVEHHAAEHGETEQHAADAQAASQAGDNPVPHADGAGAHAHEETEHAKGDITAIVVKPKGLLEMQMLKQKFGELPGVQAAYSSKAVADVLNIVDVGANIVAIIAGASALIAAISILLSLCAAAAERQKDIGLLRLLGKPQSTIMGGVVLEGAILTGLGCMLGLLLGHVGAWMLSGIIFQYAGVEIQPWTPVVAELYIIAAALVIGVLSSIWPAVRSYRVHPLELFR
ncbi:ABC transporter permease [Paenibacillus xerothermodurans]|nr:ABC transporter permease [Paenibacillus xerothermodurans]